MRAAEEAAREVVLRVHPTEEAEQRRQDVIGYAKRLIGTSLGCEVRASSPRSLPPTKPSGVHVPDRQLRRVHACDPIYPADLPQGRFAYGLAVGVAGEVLPETLERMIRLCPKVLVDVQALIRAFDGEGNVRHVALEGTRYARLLPRVAFLKASSEEAPYVGVETARQRCCVIVTEGRDGCRLYWDSGEARVAPFPAVQVDPTGAGDSFLACFAAELLWGLSGTDAALLGNFFGAAAAVAVHVLDGAVHVLVPVYSILPQLEISRCLPCGHVYGRSCLERWLLQCGKKNATVHCPVAAHIDFMSVTNRKEIEQLSPVSVPEPPAEDFSYGENIKLDTTYPHGEAIENVETALEVVEHAAEVTEKLAANVANSLPENGSLHKVAEEVEYIAEEVDKDAHKVEVIIKKIEVVSEQIDAAVEPVIEELEKEFKPNPASYAGSDAQK